MKRLMFDRSLMAGAMLGTLILTAGACVPARAGELSEPPYADANAMGARDAKSSSKAESSAQLLSWTFANQGGLFAVALVGGENPCGGNGWWGFDATTPGGKVLMSQLLAAKGMGKKVKLFCSGAYGTLNNITDMYMID